MVCLSVLLALDRAAKLSEAGVFVFGMQKQLSWVFVLFCFSFSSGNLV